MSDNTSTDTDCHLVLVCGPAGVGKTTVARRIAECLGGDVLRTDVVRKDLFDNPQYTSEEKQRVYTEVFERAKAVLSDSGVAVLDATFSASEHRDRAYELATETGADLQIVKVECARNVVQTRMANREEDESDAGFEIHLHHLDTFDPIERAHTTIDNSGDLTETTSQVVSQFDDLTKSR